MEPNYVELACGAYRDALALAMLGMTDHANAQLAHANRYAALALESTRGARRLTPNQ
jgi:hypothetical protein